MYIVFTTKNKKLFLSRGKNVHYGQHIKLLDLTFIYYSVQKRLINCIINSFYNSCVQQYLVVKEDWKGEKMYYVWGPPKMCSNLFIKTKMFKKNT